MLQCKPTHYLEKSLTTLQLSNPVKFAKGAIITQANTLVEGEVASCDGTSVTLINVDGGKKLTVDSNVTWKMLQTYHPIKTS